MSTEDARLIRIEEKLDKISEALVTLARVEEKIADLEERRQEHSEELRVVVERITSINTTVVRAHERLDTLHRIVWFGVAAFATSILTQLTTLL